MYGTEASARRSDHVQCDTSCDVLHDRTSVAAGDSATVNVSNEGIRVGYLVERESGKPIGCIYEKFNGVHSTPTMRVSTAQKCF
jgi:alkyl hydroperoxide reductase subunit AhpF